MNTARKIIILALILSLVLPMSVLAYEPAHLNQTASPNSTISFTILHTNDFHGNLEPAGSNPGMARTAHVINGVRDSVGVENVLLLDGGDFMQGSLISNIQKGIPTVAVYNAMGYAATVFGNHEFDWGQEVLISRTVQADFPFLAANLTINDTGNCATAGWDVPAFATPWITTTVGTVDNPVVVGIIGATSIETPFITIAAATEGLCFRDPAEGILRYYDELETESDFIVVLSHLGLNDGGYGYGFPVYGDQTLASKLNVAGKPVNLIIGGHSHIDMTAPVIVGNTTVVQAHYAGRKVGRADVTLDTTTGQATVSWQRLVVDPSTTPQDSTIKDLINTYVNDPDYQELVNTVIGFTNVDLIRDYNGDSTMGAFIQDAIYNDLNSDIDLDNDADIVFNNPGGIRADIVAATTPYTLTYGLLYGVLPFGNQTVVGDMTGAQIVELLNQSATLFKGALQPGGLRYKFYRYGNVNNFWAWGAYDIEVLDRDTGTYEAIEYDRVYRVATNEFLAPAGQDGFAAFKYMTNISYHGDMLDGVIRWVSDNFDLDNPYDASVDGRIVRNGNDDGGTIVPVTILHNNDSHGYLDNYAKLASLIKTRRALNPEYTLLLNGGDQIQGDSMMYYFKSAALGYAADGTVLTGTMSTHPLISVMNALEYDAMVVGNHEYNFGKDVFTSVLSQADFPMLQANVADTGEYGISSVPVEPYTSFTLGDEGIKVAVLGIGNHRVPSYELPSNIPGLTFGNPIDTAEMYAPVLKAENDMVIALTHIGFTGDPNSVEVDENVDTVLAAEAPGIDVIVGGHSHTSPKSGFGAYKWLPTFVGGPDNTPVMVSQASRRNTFLGELVVGFIPDGEGIYRVAGQAGRYHEVVTATPVDSEISALIQPYKDLLAAYNDTVIGETAVPLDARTAYTEETNAANLQADASVFELASYGIEVDFHISGAMTNGFVALDATAENPVTLKVSDMFTLMPYENSLVVMEMNGPQLKRVLERAYRNYYYYKYVPGRGGYSYYTTCMLDINAGGEITYRDTYPMLPNGENVESLVFSGQAVNFNDADTYYKVSTVNYLAAGACNFSDQGETLWPLDQIIYDTQYYVRDAVINYISAQSGTIAPAKEDRLVFLSGIELNVTPAGDTFAIEQDGRAITITVPADAVLTPVTLHFTLLTNPTYPGSFEFAGVAFNVEAYDSEGNYLPGFEFEIPVEITILYTDEDVEGMDEASLRVYYWDGESWVDGACTPYLRDLEANQISFSICHLSTFALFEVLYDVSLTTETAVKVGNPGDEVVFDLTVTNLGQETDTYNIAVESEWDVVLPTEVGPVDPAGVMTFSVTVTIPLDATPAEMDMILVTAASQGNPEISDSVSLSVVYPTDYGILLSSTETEQEVLPGGTVEYSFTITNIGNITDTYTLTLTSDGVTVEFDEASVTLASGESATLTFTVTVPEEAEVGAEFVVTLLAVSETDEAVAASLDFTTTVVEEVVTIYNIFLPLIHKVYAAP